jgi:DNA polymerase-3 subunit chi
MGRVDFYVLPENSQRERFVCGLAAKAMQTGHRVYIYSPDQHVAELLDEMLWTFQDISFVPHEMTTNALIADCPVLIGSEEKLPTGCDVMINLSESVPASADQCSRVVEIVAGNENMKKHARDRYRNYRERQFELHSHTIGRV